MCTEERTVPVGEVIVGGAAAAGGLELLLFSRGDDSDGVTHGVAVAAIALAAVTLPSAWLGFRRTGECRRQRHEYLIRYGEPGERPGAEGEACHPRAGCAPGLVCASNLCVRPPSPPPGATPEAP
jgi:hypothetical protein